MIDNPRFTLATYKYTQNVTQTLIVPIMAHTSLGKVRGPHAFTFFDCGRFMLCPPHALYVLVVFYARDLSPNPLLVLRLLEPVRPPIEHIIGIDNPEIHICDFQHNA